MEIFKELVKEVMDYESDTFSASGQQITEAEAEHVVASIIRSLWDNRIDGVLIAKTLDEYRDN